MAPSILSTDAPEAVRFNALEAVNTGLNATVRNAATGNVKLVGFEFHNGDAARRYIQVFFRPAAEVTLGTTEPDLIYELPTSAYRYEEFTWPVQSMNGLSLACTTTQTGSTGATVAATGHVLIRR